MENDPSQGKAEDAARAIFRQKEEFHRSQARLPIEEKIRILVELQKIAISVQPAKGQTDRRMVWRLG
jgi:hypothetical protein